MQSVESQRIGHDLATKQQQYCMRGYENVGQLVGTVPRQGTSRACQMSWYQYGPLKTHHLSGCETSVSLSMWAERCL